MSSPRSRPASTPEGLPAGSGDELLDAESVDEAAAEYTQPGEPPAPEAADQTGRLTADTEKEHTIMARPAPASPPTGG